MADTRTCMPASRSDFGHPPHHAASCWGAMWPAQYLLRASYLSQEGTTP